jgi:sec-independent protein translocase protein TatA
MGEFSISHVLILTLILLIFFGPSRLPALGQSIGKAIKGFKDGMNDVHNEVNKSVDQDSQQNQIAGQNGEPLNQKKDDKSHQNNS